MKKTVLAGFDIGTSKIRCILFNINGSIINSFEKVTPIIKKKDGEYNPVNKLFELCIKILQETFKYSNSNNLIVKGISFSSVGEAGVVIDKNNLPIMDIIPWYDQRTSEIRNKYLKKNKNNFIYNNTGMNNDHFYSAYKILWIKNNKPNIYNKIYKWLPINDYVATKLTGDLSTDFSQAMRTLLFDTKNLKWSKKMLKFFGIRSDILPNIRNAGEKKGYFNKYFKKKFLLNYNCIVGTGGHDHFVGVFGLGGFKENTLVDSLGSAEAVTISTKKYLSNKKFCNSKFISGVFKTKKNTNFYLVGSILTSGLIINWFMKNFKINNYKELDLLIEKTKDKNIFFFPQFEYSHTPINNINTKGFIIGIDRSTTKGDIYKSILESLSFDTKNIINFVKNNSNIKINRIICSGGSVKNKKWMKIKSNVLGKNIYLDKRVENVSLGSAILAGLASKIYKDEDEAFKRIKDQYTIITKDKFRANYYNKIFQKYLNNIDNLYKINKII